MITSVTPESLEKLLRVIYGCVKEEKIRDMTSEEAIRELEMDNSTLNNTIMFNQDNLPESDNYPLRRQVKANELAIQALNKENPQKVIADYDYLGFEKCPKCKYGNLLDSKYTQFEYCPMCGQRLDWE